MLVHRRVTPVAHRIRWYRFIYLGGVVKGKKVAVDKVCIRAKVAHQAGAFPGFCSIKRLGILIFSPGWDASPSQGYPPALNFPVPIYTPGWREAL